MRVEGTGIGIVGRLPCGFGVMGLREGVGKVRGSIVKCCVMGGICLADLRELRNFVA